MLCNKTKRILGLFLLMLMISTLMMPIMVFAEVINVSVPTELSSSVEDAISKVNTKFGNGNNSQDRMFVKSDGQVLEVATFKNDVLIFTDNWNKVNDRDKNDVFEYFANEINNSGADEAQVHELFTDIQKQDNSISATMLGVIYNNTFADLWKAYQIVKPFLDILNVVLGVGCVIIIMLLFASTVMDLAYIGLPVWREAQASKDGGKKHPFGVSYEAISTVEEIEKGLGGGDGGYRNSYLLYFKRRALTYIVLALCIMYLICGGISGLITFVLKLTTGMVF